MSTKAYEHFRKKLRQLIDELAGGSVHTFAKLCDMKTAAPIYRWLDGEHAPGLDSLEQISKGTGIPVALLISDGALPIMVRTPLSDEQILALVGNGLAALREKIPQYDMELCTLLSKLSDGEKKIFLGELKRRISERKKLKG